MAIIAQWIFGVLDNFILLRLLWRMRDPPAAAERTRMSCSAEQGNQVKILNTFRTQASDSVAVSVERGILLRKQVTGPSDRNRAGKAGRPASADFRRNTQVRRPTEGTSPPFRRGKEQDLTFLQKQADLPAFLFSLRVPSVVLRSRTTGRASLGRANGYGWTKE